MSYDFKITGGDWTIGSNGDLEIVEDSDKLVQDVLKMIHFPLGKHKLYPWYGCAISGSMIGSVMDTEFLSTMASNQLNFSLEMLQRLQKEQAKVQSVTPFELLAATKEISVQRSSVDPRYYSVFLKLLSRALKTISTGFVIQSSL